MKAIALAKEDGQDFIRPIEEEVISGKYPLARFLYIYVNKDPNKPLPPLEAEFLKMVLSKTGQQIVEKDGYISLPTKIVEQELAKLK